ncbi:MAG: amidase [Candidatus Eremiobacteraeota bacterium]|nr:amidase [Candidatus Eremiobacteraeota bacterium]
MLVDEPSRRREVSAETLARAMLERIERHDVYRALETTTPELALADARRVDAARAQKSPLPLDGLPIVVKDNVDVGGVRCGVGSKLFANRVAECDATVVRLLREAGAIVLGKTCLHEFAFGATSISILGACRNPWDPSRIAGGSSGGSGIAVAADFAVGALGTDTGGSVRLPAALCGIVGLRPTHGAVSNHGVQPLSPSFDTVGPMARSAADASALFAIMRRYDPDDPWSAKAPPHATISGDGLRGLRIAVLEPFFFEGIDPQIDGLIRAAIATLSELGARIVEFELAGVAEAYRAVTEMARAEATAVYEPYLDDPAVEMSDGVRERFALGRKLTGVGFANALRVMMRWRRELAHVFESSADLLLTPGVSRPTFPIEGTRNLEATEILTRMTYPWSFAGVPAICVPCGFRDDGMPVGFQLIAAPWREDLLFAAAERYQSVTSWHRARPKLAEAVSASGVK